MDSYPALPAFVLALVALFLKTSLTSALQVASRFRFRSFLLPEDAALVGLKPVLTEAALTQRCANVWRNDTENLPLFLALALAYVLLGASLASAGLWFGLYVALRYAHTAIYLSALQPWRALLFLSGMAVCWVIAVKSVPLALSAAGAWR